ncbi:MAG: hypothetical protein ACI9IP_002092 [Arcticibacterium sp.]|jgi:hypothetical protein
MRVWIDLSSSIKRTSSMRFKLSLLLILLGTTNAFSQTREYAVKVLGIRVGTIMATKTPKGESFTYGLSSEVDVNFLVYKLQVDYKVRSTLANNGLANSKVTVISNRGNYTTETSKTTLGFMANCKRPENEIKKEIDDKILATFASAFFNEPAALNQIYAEFYADFIQMTNLGEGKYQGVLDKNVDEFHYENGLLVKLIKKNPITNMVIEYQAISNKTAR